ncbi:hypothetical protein LZP81_30935 [Streptomyces parvulus]|uniref:hypothetical protein n=1 Tax=Streptomyces parvulus TaxID=146923 RepID=UPI001E612722|nr:hypothetical protein [Streptomyces parvulus]MCC9154879.1 hypothetical protein [Streptomyces parvulus]MCE7691276.1 hypothetical protein [Streptomyces parvulus]
MTDTKVAYPSTPGAIAAAVLDAVEQNPEAFDMTSWLYLPDADLLRPNETPTCGTTMCIAGWAAHLTGWTLSNGAHGAHVATKDGRTRWIEDVAQEALGLDMPDLFHKHARTALAELREIAGR